tara:strand:- start:1775 stop:2029 length:255 start_codon:yes stop_codon:yes gene_type:complete
MNNRTEWETSIVEIEDEFRQLASKYKVAFSLFLPEDYIPPRVLVTPSLIERVADELQATVDNRLKDKNDFSLASCDLNYTYDNI